jgi:hypothetical protein
MNARPMDDWSDDALADAVSIINTFRKCGGKPIYFTPNRFAASAAIRELVRIGRVIPLVTNGFIRCDIAQADRRGA